MTTNCPSVPLSLVSITMSVTVPLMLANTLEDIAPFACAISWPFATLSPTFTQGMAGLPSDWLMAMVTLGGSGSSSIGASFARDFMSGT